LTIAPPLSTIGPSANRDASDERLAQAFASHEDWALAEVYRRHAPLLYSVALGVLHETESAEDCVHDVVVRLWQRRGAYRAERGSLRAFLVVAVRNDALTRRRTAIRRDELLPRFFEHAVEPDPAQRTIEPRLESRMNQLPEDQRDVLVLAYGRGMTQHEISEELQIPLGTVKSRMHLALRRLARELGAPQPS
jgi:RNA polymerase sigma-70 factor, ECF subfamily